MKIAGVIVAGGRSTRMGEEKIFAKIGGKSILDRIVERVAHQVDRLAINANGDVTRFKSAGLAVIPDLPNDVLTPLAGLHAALDWASTHKFDALLTLPSDTPFLPTDLVTKLAACKQSAAIAASGEQDHYLTGLWSASLVEALEHAIKNGISSVKDWTSQVGAVTVRWATHPFDPFFNINTPADLAKAHLIAKQLDS